MHITNLDLTRLQNFAKHWASQLRAGDFIALDGALGAGKTTLCQMLIAAHISENIAVTSPTFSLLHFYDHATLPILHMDLYRLTHADMVCELGYEDHAATSVILCEWATNMGSWLPRNRLNVTLEAAKDNTRSITCTAHGHARIPKL
ncbi:MAG: tRNA (adenosine(37)-N6)-threonylcarbamoyltransferase complex ATPase subunit type 1 TsaE [Pseudomonadota bacterium]